MISDRFRFDHQKNNMEWTQKDHEPSKRAQGYLGRPTWMPHFSRHSRRLFWQPSSQWFGAEVFSSPGQLMCERRHQLDRGQGSGAHMAETFNIEFGVKKLLVFIFQFSNGYMWMISCTRDTVEYCLFPICPSLHECCWSKERLQCKVTWSGNTDSTSLIAEWIFHFSKIELQICAQQSRSQCPSLYRNFPPNNKDKTASLVSTKTVISI